MNFSDGWAGVFISFCVLEKLFIPGWSLSYLKNKNHLGSGKSKAIVPTAWLNQLLKYYKTLKSYRVTPESLTGKILATAFTESL